MAVVVVLIGVLIVVDVEVEAVTEVSGKAVVGEDVVVAVVFEIALRNDSGSATAVW